MPLHRSTQPTDEVNPFAAPARDAPHPSDFHPDGAGPRGLGGWLILPLLGLIAVPLQAVLDVALVYVRVFEPGRAWELFTNESSASFIPMWATLVTVDVFMNVAFSFLAVVALLLMFRHSRKLPRVMIALYLLSAVYLVANAGFFSAVGMGPSLAALQPPVFPARLPEVLGAAVSALVGVPYFCISKRVKNTFVK